MKIGTVTLGSSSQDLTGSSFGSFATGLDDAVAATLRDGGSFAYAGPLFAGGAIEAIKIDGQTPANLPATVDVQSEAALAIVALCLRDGDAVRFYLPSQPGILSGRWVDVARVPEFQAMAESDRDQQRKAWISVLGKVPAGNWPAGIDLSKKTLAAVSAPALRILLAYVATYACPVTGVNQPADKYRGGQSHGVTLPVLRYPVSEPDCYVRVISGREGLLESINAYDLKAGISLGSIQFNVNRAAIFRFLFAFNKADGDLFGTCFGSLGWSPSQVMIGSDRFFALDVLDAAGRAVQLVGRETDHDRNCGYFQSAVPGNDSYAQIDANFRKRLAAAFRDAVMWPHVQEVVMSVSAEWLRPGLQDIEAAGIPPVDSLRPDRDTFILKALLLSAYVRYSACLAPLLKALRPYASPVAKLAALNGVLLASDTWSSCDHSRRSKLAERLTAQKPDAIAAWEVIDRLSGSRSRQGDERTGAVVAALETDTADHSCDHHGGPAFTGRRLWDTQATAANTGLGDVSQRFEALLEGEINRTRGRKSAKAGSSGAGRARPIASGDIVFKTSKSGRYKIALVDAVHGDDLHVRNLEGIYKCWRAKDVRKRHSALQVLVPAKSVLRQMEALQEASVFADPWLAIPPFESDERRVIVTPLLTPNDNQAAFVWGAQRHPSVSGVGLGRIAAALESYVDFAAVKAAIAAANGATSATDDAVLVEAIHQFQRKVYVDAAQCDGRCGESTLDSLGLYLGRPGLNQVDVANPTAQARLNAVDRKLVGVADNPAAPATLNAANWFRHITASAFLGQTFRNGIHAVLLRRLRSAERHLLGLSAYRGLTPVKLGLAVGIGEFHRGSRPTATTHSMHTFGLATDLNYSGNPWIEGGDIVRVLQRARLLVSGQMLDNYSTTAGLLHAKLANRPTAEIYDTLWGFDREFRSYLALRDDADELRHLLEGHRQSGTPGIFNAGETTDHAADRWRNTVTADLAGLGANDGFVDRDPRNGFLNLSRDLVIALRDFGCLAWGASDFGPGASGDIMHFDCRNTGLGRIVNVGFVPPERTCA
ncbi:hypothetical protein NKI59_26920 [Mesorhizobium sp. M0598]|uniref:hypothetical protein n=1 Tax=Mesorhizobium sp. M0598 TaxID=2956968 RepID=UPI00333C9300